MNRKPYEFFGNQFSYGLILRANLDTIDDIWEFLAEHRDIMVIFQKISTSKLWIKEGEDTHDK